ncbi:pantetheinase-like [Ambystoma mexicanum]|uniref:pantetheinase-like n=1 Tax=Ambystoma mexicanum TaxID=8296 RepID=UPI0037E99A45
MAAFRALSCVLLLSVCNGRTVDHYLAAVYEHVPVVRNASDAPATVGQALELMNKNMDILESAITRASKAGASIIVTPELGIFGWNFTRESIVAFLEDIPSPAANWIPCADPKRFGPTPVQERLSCMAKQNSIYVVANVGDKKPCHPSSNTTCREDRQYFYNTLVVYDSDGKLVARYHKYYLFYEDYFDRPQQPERVTFDAPFGKFGLFTCFDILFYDPAVALVENLQIESVVFPTAWMNILPHLNALEYHSAWAMAMGVNLFSSNINNKELHWTGSGVFPLNGPGSYYYNSKSEEGHLVISQVNCSTRNPKPFHSTTRWNQYATSIPRFPKGENDFSALVIYDNFTFTELRKAQGNYTVCHNDLCCHLSYRMEDKRADEVYALGAFDGMHTAQDPFYLQICTLLKCKTTDLKTCGKPAEESLTKFESFSLSGTFGTKYVFPLLLFSGIELGKEYFEVLKDGRLVSRASIATKPLLTATLYGRWYEKDPSRP